MLSYLPCCLLPGIALALVTRTQDEEIHGLVNGAGRAEADQDTDRETARLSAVAAATKLHPASIRLSVRLQGTMGAYNLVIH